MNPRLKSSKKWTAFPKEYSEQIQTVFTENFAAYLGDAKLIVEGRIFTEEIMLRVGYIEEGRLAQSNFEVSMNYSQSEQDAVARIHNCIDAAAGMMMEFLENEGEADLPYTWKEFPFQGKTVFLQYNTENSSLEEEANKILGKELESLYIEADDDEEDALSRAETSEELSPPRDEDDEFAEAADEGLDDEDEEAEPGPKMFSGKKKKKDDLR